MVKRNNFHYKTKKRLCIIMIKNEGEEEFIMRKYVAGNEKKIIDIYCNKCGKNIKVENNIVKEGVFSIDYKWGYFSRRDSEIHSFDLCEECYEELLNSFVIETEIVEGNEFL